MYRFLAVILSLLLLTTCAMAQSPLDQLLNKATGKPAPSDSPASKPATTSLSTDKITAGLKEALQISTTKAVDLTGRPGGFLQNEAIKIPLPDKLRTAARGLRLVGMGPQLDELEVGMNRAAERAAPQAKQIFFNALMKMSIDDARRILTGNPTAATDYFRNASSADLATAFQPIVHTAMQNVGVIQQFSRITQNSIAAPALQKFDLDGYVVGKTLDGLFYMLGQQEKQIRSNPAAQTTTLLKQVFGSLK